LDGTICFPNLDEDGSDERYGAARPNRETIAYMRTLREQGYHITIYTARRMLTHEGSIQKIKDDVGQITYEWLRRYTVPYDNLVWGKPYSSTFYVDDKAMTLEGLKDWMNQ